MKKKFCLLFITICLALTAFGCSTNNKQLTEYTSDVSTVINITNAIKRDLKSLSISRLLITPNEKLKSYDIVIEIKLSELNTAKEYIERSAKSFDKHIAADFHNNTTYILTDSSGSEAIIYTTSKQGLPLITDNRKTPPTIKSIKSQDEFNQYFDNLEG